MPLTGHNHFRDLQRRAGAWDRLNYDWITT